MENVRSGVECVKGRRPSNNFLEWKAPSLGTQNDRVSYKPFQASQSKALSDASARAEAL